MIIKGERISTARAAAPILRHLVKGEDNDDAPVVVQGTEADVRDAFTDAGRLDRRFALRHFIIAPQAETSRADALMVLGLLGAEYGFDPKAAFVVEHTKSRAAVEPVAVDAPFGTHWHALVNEQDTISGRTLSSSFNYLRNEKIARVSEYRLGQLPGRQTDSRGGRTPVKTQIILQQNPRHGPVAAPARGEAHRIHF